MIKGLKKSPIRLGLLGVALLIGIAGCYRDAGNDSVSPTRVNVRELSQIQSTPLPTNPPAIPTFTSAPQIAATKTLIVGGPPVSNTTPSPSPDIPTFTPPPTVSLADATLPPAGFGDTGISPTPSLTPTLTLAPGLPTPTPVEEPDRCIHIVQQGDTLFRIATDNDLQPEDFYPVNPELAANPNALYIGQEIRIPGCVSQTPTGQPGVNVTVTILPGATPTTGPGSLPPGWQTYVVQQGDTLFRIATRFGVTVQAIVDATDFLVNENTIIRPGDVLIIPAPQ
jgi:LysM repeat protein